MKDVHQFRRLREELGMSRREVVDLLRPDVTSEESVRRWEADRRAPSWAMERLFRLLTEIPLVAGGDLDPIGSIRWRRPDPTAAYFALVAGGQRMALAGIQDGDILVAQEQAEAGHGQTVVVVERGQLLVRQVRRRGGSTLLCSDSGCAPPAEALTIVGAVCDVLPLGAG